MFSTAVHCVFFSHCNALNHGLSYRGYYYSQCMKEIKGKSILVRVSARFELSGVDCIFIPEYDQSNAPLNGYHELPGGGGGEGSHTNTTGTFFVSLTGRIEILGPVSRKIR